jgi:ABC-type branched-subunit amino acid transport system substrate-binding protein
MMSWIGRPFRRLRLWMRRHPVRTGLIGIVVLACVAALIVFWGTLFPPQCGPGMSASGDACIGVDLASGQISKGEPAEMGALEADIKANNDIRTSDGQPSQDYISIVLLQDFSPVTGVDTRSYSDAYPDIEGAITAAWRANHTAAVQGSLPKVKLFLGNMGSQYAHWSDAVDQIVANAAANHITSVIGLGQSTDATRAAAARIVDKAHLPVIGATVTGDTMNFYPDSTRRNNGFFRVSPTNTDTAAVASRYIANIQPDQSHVAIVQDNVPGDGYNQTLASAADSYMPAAHRFPFTSPASLPPGIKRSQELIRQFSFLDQNICSVAPKVIYFAGRGADLGAFVQTWTQAGTPCANGKLTVVTGDDGGAAIDDPALHQAVRAGVTVLFTAEASADEWGPCPANTAPGIEQASYDAFQAVFTGQPDVCTHQHVTADDGAAPLSFGLPDLRSGEAILAHDAGVVAIIAARQADRDVDNAADGGIVVRDPYSQVGFIEEMRCTNRVQGASGLIQFSQDSASYGNPIAKPVPVVEIHADGTTSTVSAAPGAAPAVTC